MRTELKLRVSGLYRPGEHVYPSGQMPLVQLVGSWLEKAGFPVGTAVRVEVVEDGRLVMTRAEEEAEERAGRSAIASVPHYPRVPRESRPPEVVHV